MGVTRAPSLLNNDSSPTETTTNGRLFNGVGIGKDDDFGNGSIVGISGGLINDDDDEYDGPKKRANENADGEEPESLQYIKPAEDDLNMAYSEGTQKTDLLYWRGEKNWERMYSKLLLWFSLLLYYTYID